MSKPFYQIESSVVCSKIPEWAKLERELFQTLNQSIDIFLNKYTYEDGSLIWDSKISGRDGGDDFYEAFSNWSLFYILGGRSDLGVIAFKQWKAITKQLNHLGVTFNDYELGYDWFHQSESNIFFYYLCWANPTNSDLIQLSEKFGEMYLDKPKSPGNYDSEKNIVRAPHNGSGGPRWGFGWHNDYPYYGLPENAGMKRYGLPYYDVEKIESFEDLRDPVLAKRMGDIMNDRLGEGDVVSNLSISGLMLNAFLMTGNIEFKEWILKYVDGWIERTENNEGIIPDNVGLSGLIGEKLNGKWYGGCYGWSWPHGFYNVAYSVIVACQNAFVLTKNYKYLDFAKSQIDLVVNKGKMVQTVDIPESSVPSDEAFRLFDLLSETFVVPFKYAEKGWFEFHPLSPIFYCAIWNICMKKEYFIDIEVLRQKSGYDWRNVINFRTKEDSGHEQPWLRYICGKNSKYPEKILLQALEQVNHRVRKIENDQSDLKNVNIHHWQEHNPVTTEALVQLTLGAPQIIYNGGFLFSSIRYFDFDKKKPGLPEDISALVTNSQEKKISLTLVNLNETNIKNIIIQAGSMGEHSFGTIRYQISENSQFQESVINNRYLKVSMKPETQIKIELDISRSVNDITYQFPWMT
ncbi:MAG: hypothetical protein FI687_01490 [SAR202 cluster bacterium]|nr:hypothetical protein [SAR202 cluster bacterium]|tara:strand:- start:2690 stop:4588 length:1899 start_codon:yes stop_codon:yes gene_type:complete